MHVKRIMDINTSDIYEPDSDPQITRVLYPVKIWESHVTLTAVVSLTKTIQASVLITDEDENWLQSSTSDDDFGCSPIAYSSDECGNEGKTLQIIYNSHSPMAMMNNSKL